MPSFILFAMNMALVANMALNLQHSLTPSISMFFGYSFARHNHIHVCST